MSVLMRVYFSTYHLFAAKHFSNLTKSIEDEVIPKKRFNIKHRAYVTNSIFSATAFIEAAINELFQDVTDLHGSNISNLDPEGKKLMSEFWQATEAQNKSFLSILDKYQKALDLLHIQNFNSGKSPFQDITLLIKLRNELVHYKPKTLGEKNKHSLYHNLNHKFPENKHMKGTANPWFPDKCLGHGCTEWAITSVTNFADQFFSKIDIKPNYQKVPFK